MLRTAPLRPATRRHVGWLVCVTVFLALSGAGFCEAQVSIMPLGDSIIKGGGVGNPTNQAGYRDRLYTDLNAAHVSFSFIGATNTYASASLTSANDQYHNGYGSYTLGDLYGNLAANGGNPHNGDGNQGGYWLTGGGGTDRAAVYPGILTVMAGTNDADYSNGAGLAQMETNMDNVLTWFAVNRPGTKEVVGNVIPWNQTGTYKAAIDLQITNFNAWLRTTEIPKFPGMTLVDMNTLFRNQDGTVNTNLYSTDGIHPDVAGYGAMGDAWAAAVIADVPEPATWAPLLVAAGVLSLRAGKRACFFQCRRLPRRST